MASIRFKDKNGNCFLLYVTNASWGTGDYNTPEEAVVVPQTIVNLNRCLGTIVLSTPKGPVTLDFNLNGRTGSCNQCGQCCSHLASTCPARPTCCYIIDGIYHRCSHLVIRAPGIGKRNGTECGIFNRLLYEGYKQCLAWPSQPNEVEGRPFCGFRFP